MRSPNPLQWPDGWKRTPPDQRKASQFHVKRKPDGSNWAKRFELPFTATYNQLVDELRRLGAVNPVITTDMPLNTKGVPYANARAGHDPGIAVWFSLPDANGDMHERVMPCDRWNTPADNMYAIALSIQAMRGIERWGAAEVVNRAFSGFTALPPGSGETVNARPAPPKKPWFVVLELGDRDGLAAPYRALLNEDVLVIAKAKHRKLMSEAHPDKEGGDNDRAVELNTALEDAEKALAP